MSRCGLRIFIWRGRTWCLRRLIICGGGIVATRIAGIVRIRSRGEGVVAQAYGAWRAFIYRAFSARHFRRTKPRATPWAVIERVFGPWERSRLWRGERERTAGAEAHSVVGFYGTAEAMPLTRPGWCSVSAVVTEDSGFPAGMTERKARARSRPFAALRMTNQCCAQDGKSM
jgi:hypothetical protein